MESKIDYEFLASLMHQEDAQSVVSNSINQLSLDQNTSTSCTPVPNSQQQNNKFRFNSNSKASDQGYVTPTNEYNLDCEDGSPLPFPLTEKYSIESQEPENMLISTQSQNFENNGQFFDGNTENRRNFNLNFEPATGPAEDGDNTTQEEKSSFIMKSIDVQDLSQVENCPRYSPPDDFKDDEAEILNPEIDHSVQEEEPENLFDIDSFIVSGLPQTPKKPDRKMKKIQNQEKPKEVNQKDFINL